MDGSARAGIGKPMHKTPNFAGHIRLTSHPDPLKPARFPIRWGAPSARERGPVIGTVSRPADRNVVGAHGGSYSLYRALAVTSGALSPIHTPDLRDTAPVIEIVGSRRLANRVSLVYTGRLAPASVRGLAVHLMVPPVERSRAVS